MFNGIRARLVFLVCILFVFIGGLIYFPLIHILPQKIIYQISKRDAQSAKFIANDIKNLLLLNDTVGLSLLLYDYGDNLEDAQYLFVRSADGRIVAHTFPEGFPKGLLLFRSDMKHPYTIKEFLRQDKKIYDIAVPILGGDMGEFHLGVSLESDEKYIEEISKINKYVGAVILVGLAFGIGVFLFIGFLFSRQIIKLKDFALKVGKGDLEAKIDVRSKDEIGTLSHVFNDMALRLKENIQEIKRLNIIEERNKIAMDFHDGCAQDMANIIKRLELCEKLFKIDPEKAFGELEALRKTSKEALNRTRQIIFDLKSSEDTDFDLSKNLAHYIMRYQKESNIDVKLAVLASTDNIHPVKAKSIYYMIIEALSNVRKHSRARKIEVSLVTDSKNHLVINIKDNGLGFDVRGAKLIAGKEKRLGLVSLHQRADLCGGRCVIESKPEQGTRVSINIPLNELVV